MTKPFSMVALALASSLCLPNSVEAQCGTIINSNVVNQTWTPAGSPYCVTAQGLDVTQLTIQPGVTVRFNNAIFIRVIGTIQAVGTPANPIVFTAANAAQPWRGINVISGIPGSRFSHCRFDTTRTGAALTLTETDVQIDNCTFLSGGGGGIRATLSTGNLVVDDCAFTANGFANRDGGGVHATMGTGDVIVSNSSFTGNASNGSGGGIGALMGSGNVVVTDCSFDANLCLVNGGGIYAALAGGQLTVTDSTFDANRADVMTFLGETGGGGLYVSGGDSMIERCAFTSNVSRGFRSEHTAIGRGGAIFFGLGNAVMENCSVVGNQAEGQFSFATVQGAANAYGGGVYMGFASLQATNCLWSSNVCVVGGTTNIFDRGGNLYNEGLPATIDNCTFNGGRTTTNVGGGVWINGGTSTITDSIVWANEGTDIDGPGTTNVSYSDVDGGVLPGTGNISADPLFTSMAPGSEIIGLGSPCIDAGDPASANDDVCFPPSLGMARNDMGAHGGPLACGWIAPANLVLSVPATVDTPSPFSLDMSGGNPGNPSIFVITGVNGVPVFTALPILIMTTASGTSSLPLNIPLMASPVTLDFQGYALDGMGSIVSSNVEPVLFR